MMYTPCVRTTFDIDQQTYRLVKAIAAQRGVTMGTVVNEAVLRQYGSAKEPSLTIRRSASGWPVISIGRTITSEEVAEALDED